MCLLDGSCDVFPDPTRRGIDLQGVVDLTQRWFGDGGFTHMQGVAVALAECGGDPLLDRQDRAQTVPAQVLVLRRQLVPDRLDQLVGQHGDEQVRLGAAFGVVEHRPEAEVRFQAAEHGFQIGQHSVGAPQRGVVPGDFVAARVGQLGPVERGLLPGDGGGIQAGVIGGDGDFIMLADPAAFLLQPPDALLDRRDGLVGAWLGQAVSEFGQACLERRDAACADRRLLGLASGGVAVEPDDSLVP